MNLLLLPLAVSANVIDAHSSFTSHVNSIRQWSGNNAFRNRVSPGSGGNAAFVQHRSRAFHQQNFRKKRNKSISSLLSFRPPVYLADGKRTTKLLFFKSNENSEIDQNTELMSMKGKDDDNESDLPAWMKALVKWEVSDSASKISSATAKNEGISFDSFPFSIGDKSENIWENEMSPLVASLSGMVNVEALIAAASSSEINKDMGSLLPDLKLLAEEESKNNAMAPDVEPTDIFSLDSGTYLQLSESKTFPFLENSLSWDKFVPLLQKNIQELSYLISDDNKQADFNVTREEISAIIDDVIQENDLVKNLSITSSPSFNTIVATEKILRDATQRLEFLLNGTSSAFSPAALQDLILRASNSLAIQEASGNLTAAAFSVFEAAGKAPRATAQYTADLVQFANDVLAGGYVRDETKTKGIIEESLGSSAKPLFVNFPSVKNVPIQERRQAIFKASEFATLSGAIYENTLSNTLSLGHSIVAQGITAGIAWMVTDSMQSQQDFRSQFKDSEIEEPILVRTFVVRGYDASDEDVDRVGLLNTICTASPTPIKKSKKTLVSVHEGMLSIARNLWQELEKFIDMSAPGHKFVFCGHSIGGSLSLLLLILMTNSRGADFVKERVLRVFTYGSPPIFVIQDDPDAVAKGVSSSTAASGTSSADSCSILEAFGLPIYIAFGYNQPWDPIPKLYSKYDALYPLIDDLGDDGVTLYASGPNRALRPITKAILESWEGWPSYRDNAREKLGQNYVGIGRQYLLLPELIRYLTDRLVSVNIQVPPVDTVLQIAPGELLPALNEVFTLDTFAISYIPVAIRSFVHHFYPAYGLPFAEYAARLKSPSPVRDLEDADKKLFQQGQGGGDAGDRDVKSKDWTEIATQFVLGGDSNISSLK